MDDLLSFFEREIATAPMQIHLRKSAEVDVLFFQRLFYSDRGEILPELPGMVQDDILAMQYDGYIKSLSIKFPRYFDFVIVFESFPVGRLILDKVESRIRIVDFVILPDFRGRGKGSQVIRLLVDYAAASGFKLTIRMFKDNPAIDLFLNFGFESFVSEDGWLDLLL